MVPSSEVKQALRRQWIETPSWAYGNTGTRFKVFRNPGAARTQSIPEIPPTSRLLR